MDHRLLRHYNAELLHLHEMGAEFAAQFPKIAGRLGMEGIDVADPYVERLLEGSAFLAARVQLKLEEEFPRFAQRMMQIVLPQAISPTPSMLVARVAPDLANPNLARGFTVPRGTALIANPREGFDTACEFRTGAPLTLWPLELADASYLPYPTDLPLAATTATRELRGRIKGVLRLRLRAAPGVEIGALPLDTLRVFFGGGDEVAYRLHELVAGSALGVAVCAPQRPCTRIELIDAAAIRFVGLDDDEALLPVTSNAFQGYRHLREYLAFAPRFRFADLGGLARVLPGFVGRELELNVLLARGDASLERAVTRQHVLLDCVPAINLFAKRADRILVTDGVNDFHVVPDRAHPLDYEVHSLLDVRGYSAGSDDEQIFRPFYADFRGTQPGELAYYTIEREARLSGTARQREAPRTDYAGSEVYVSIVDANDAPFRSDLRQLAFHTLCTNRDLPLLMPLGGAGDDFSLDIAAPVASLRCVSGPSRPAAPCLDAGQGWRLVDHLSLNYLSLCDADAHGGAAALRALLLLHAAGNDKVALRQINGVLSVHARPVVRRLPMSGPIAFGRGLEIDVTMDDHAFEGGSAWLFGRVLERFFTRYVSINSFVQTVVRTAARGEILRRTPQCGSRPIL